MTQSQIRLLFLGALALGSGIANAAPQVSVFPTSAVLTAGQSQLFSSKVTGSNTKTVVWAVNGVQGGNSTLGTVSSTGLYTAAVSILSATSVTITATTLANPSATASAKVSLQSSGIVVTPGNVSLKAAQGQQFTATVNGKASAVAWSLNPAIGSLSGSGMYTSPSSLTTTQTATVTASANGASGSATVTISPAVTISISPSNISLKQSGSQQFTTTVSGTTNTAVIWSLNPAVGAISTSGLYTAPASITSQQTVTVTATSAADSSKTASTIVTLVPPVSITVSPTVSNLTSAQTQQLTATVTGTTNTAVTWSMNPAVGAISTSGLYTAPNPVTSQQTVTVTATSASDTTKAAAATVTLTPPLTITSTALPSGTIGASYSTTMAAAGGKTPYSWSLVSGMLPPGLALTTTTGTISGTPTAAGSYNATVQVTDTLGNHVSQILNMTMWAVLTLTPASLPTGTTGVAYNATLSATGGTAPYTWTVVSGQLPAGLTLANSGILSGTPTTAGSFTFTTLATDSTGANASRAYTVGVITVPTISISVSPPSSTLVASQTQQFTATVSGTTNTAVTWSLNPAVGTISAGGLYTAPSSVSVRQSVGVQVASMADGTKSALATITLSPPVSTSPLQITTNSLSGAAIQQSYVGVFTATGGTAPYNWSLAVGTLPNGVVLNGSNGQLTGMPTQSGQFSITINVSDVTNAVVSKSLILQVFEQGEDVYGGLTSLPCPSGPQAHFYTQKIASRWHLCTPAGNAFWMNSIYHVDATDTGTDYQGIVLASVVAQKYAEGATTNSTLNWSLQTARRMRSWGFNSLAEDAVAWVTPAGVHSDWATADNTIPVKLPFVAIAAPSWYSLTNVNGWANQPVKDLISGVKTSVFPGYRSQSADFWDPNFAMWFQNSLINDYWMQQFLTGPHSNYVISLTVDDTDFVQGFGAGRDFPTTNNGVIAPGYDQPHLGWIVLVTAPTQSSNGTFGVTYTDPTVYAKKALSDFLSAQYGGNIVTLNAAWGSRYTTFGSNGGWGVGTGLLDEDGTCPSRGASACWVTADAYALTGAPPQFAADLDAFLFRHAQTYFSTVKSIIQAQAPGVMYSGPTVLGTFGAPPRRQILQAAVQYVDVYTLGTIPPVCTDCTDVQQRVDFIAQYGGDKPWLSWEGYWAESDSYMSPFAASTDQTMLQTQGARGQLYSQRMQQLLNTRDTSSGTYHAVGIKWWELYDNRGESANWGFLTRRDDAYDGKSATTATGADSLGYPTGCLQTFGCEQGSYGDFLSWVIAANFNVLRTISSGQ